MAQTAKKRLKFDGMRGLLIVLLAGIAAYGQDQETILRTWVGYTTQLQSLPLSEEQKKEATRLGQEAQKLGFSGQFGAALKKFYEGTAVMQGVEWTPNVEVAASLECKLDHALVRAGQEVKLGCRQLYVSEREKDAKLVARIVLRGSDTTELKAKVPMTGDTWKAVALTIPEGKSGNYTVEALLSPEGEESPAKARAAYVKANPVVIGTLAAEAAKLKARIEEIRIKERPVDPTAEYALELFAKADRGEVNPQRQDWTKTFATAAAVLEADNYFAGKTGDFHRAYRSEVDQTLQPYRMFVPASYTGEKAAPLVVALHGMGGDENSMFDAYPNGALKKEAERLGFLMVAPKGRGPASMYRGDAEKDVMDVLEQVMRDYQVDKDRVYLMGHSMGGYGTWSIAANFPDRWAALGPIAGGGNPGSMEKIKHLPHFVVHGDNDKTVPVAQSRGMVEAGKKLGMNIVYVEVPGGNHTAIAAPNFGAMFDFFAKQSRGGTAAGGTK